MTTKFWAKIAADKKRVGQQKDRTIFSKSETLIKIKKVLLFIFILSIFTDSFSAENCNAGEWSLYKETEDLIIYTRTEECHDIANGLHYEYILIKIVSKTKRNQSVYLERKVYYNGNSLVSDENNERGQIIYLDAKQQIAGSCSDSNEDLRIFSRFLNYDNKPELTGFELLINTETSE